jgi:hypothetical protein
MKLIGISGKAGAGKDTIADYLFERHGYLKIAFADPLKAAAAKAFGVNPKLFYDRKAKETKLAYWDMTPRYILQVMGTEAMKGAFGENFWLKRWFLTYQQIKDTDHVVVPDCRFDAECAAIRHLGGQIWHLDRSGASLPGAAGNHASEVGPTVVASDIRITNDGSLADLYTLVELLLKRGQG